MEHRPVDLQKAVEQFGGFSNLARLLKISLSTCHAWARRGSLPEWRGEQIARLAKKRKYDVYLDVPKKRGRPRKVN